MEGYFHKNTEGFKSILEYFDYSWIQQRRYGSFFIIGQICRLVYITCNLKLISEKWTVLRVLDKESINTVESLQESYKLRPLSILQMAVIDDILATFSKY